jgi:adenylate cyclase
VRRTALFRLTAGVLIALAVTGLSWVGLGTVFQQTELRLEDGLFPAVTADPRVVVVALDEKTLADVGVFPLPRGEHARLIEALSSDGASWIGYDVTFSEQTDAEEDRALVDAMDRAGNVILGVQGSFEGSLAEGIPRAATLEAPFGELGDAAAGVASVNVFPDPDSVVRVYAPVVDFEGAYLDTLAFGLFARERSVDGPVTLRPDGVQVGGVLIPTGPGHLMTVNYAPATPQPGGFETYSMIDVLDGRVEAGAFRDRIVLVGATALGLGDTRLTPIDKQTGQAGVYVHANALNTMLTRAYLFPDSRGATVAWIFALALVVALSVAFLRVWLAPAVAVAAGAGYYLMAFYRFDRGRVMNLVYPVLAVVVSYMAALAFRYFTEFRERRRVTQVFGRYVAGDVVEEVLAAPERALATLEGVERPISVLFADLRGFTAASDGAAPTEVVAGLNIYLDAMVRAVNEEQGTIDKFMGDCVMAFWGAPRYLPNHAERAIKAALVMQEYIEEAKQKADEMGLPVPGVGVGVSTGPAVVGNIGSHERLDYTVIGDTVNTASRICGVAEAGEIVVTEECSAAVGDLFQITPLPPLKVKGKRELLKIFQVLRPRQEARVFEEGATTEAHDEKAAFEGEGPPRADRKEPETVEAPSKAAGYAPIEPGPEDTGT